MATEGGPWPQLLPNWINRRHRHSTRLDRLPSQQAQILAIPPGDHLHAHRRRTHHPRRHGQTRQAHQRQPDLRELRAPALLEAAGGFHVGAIRERQLGGDGQQ